MAISLDDLDKRITALEQSNARNFGALGSLLALVSARPAAQSLGEYDETLIAPEVADALRQWEKAAAVLQLAILDEYTPDSTNPYVAQGAAMARKAFADATHGAPPPTTPAAPI